MKNSSSATARRKSISLKRFFDWAKASGKIDQNPIQTDNPSSVSSIRIKKNKTKFKTWLIVGLSSTLVVLIFLLVSKLRSPIPSKSDLAQELPIQNPSVNQNPAVPKPSASPIPANRAVIAAWNLYAKLTLTDQNGIPEVGSQTMTFKLYNSSESTEALFTSSPQTVTTDTDGSATILIPGVPTDLFFQNEKLFLEPEMASPSGTARIPVSTANILSNLNGFPAADPETGAGPETIPVINSDGELILAGLSPTIKSREGNLLLTGQAVTIKTSDGSGGNIDINPDGIGVTNFIFEGSDGNLLNAKAPNLTTGSLYYGIVPNDSTGYNLLKLENGSSNLTTRFLVDALGNAHASGNLITDGSIVTGGLDRLTSAGKLTSIYGYSQDSGDFAISQGASDSASITRTGSALDNVLTITLDEEGQNDSSRSALVLKRTGGNLQGAALTVESGNAIFKGQVKLGEYSANPMSIGPGSIVFNTGDDNIYYSDGASWIQLATGSNSFSGSFTDLTSGTNITAAMVVGTGASLDFSGTGTINASDVTCAGCVANTELANSSLTVNSAGILTGGGSVSLGGTLTLTATEADTLAAVTSRGATTTTLVALNGGITSTGNLTIDGLVTFNGLAYTWPAAQNASYFLQTDGSGNLSWTDANTVIASTIYWNQASGALFPKNNTVDVLIGSNATASAKFAFTNVNSGTPTINVSNQATNIAVKDATANALQILEGANPYLAITTSDGTENVSFGNTSTNPSYSFLGTGLATLGGDITITGNDIIFGNAETISNATDGTVLITTPTTSLSGDLTVTGNDITFGNAETISNTTDGTVLITSPVTSLSGDLTITGNDIIFGNAETISNATDGTVLITSPVTSLSGDLKLTGADILDTNDNEFLRFTSVASAVNELTVANAAADGVVTLAATGGDTNVALSIDSKGSDTLDLNGTATGDVNIAGGSGATGCTITNSNGNLACTGTISGSGIVATSMPFSGLTSATNTQAAMVVGTGASLDYTGTGTINASTLIGATWAAPGTIGSGTPNTGTFTTLGATGDFSQTGTGTFGTGTGAVSLNGDTTIAANKNLSLASGTGSLIVNSSLSNASDQVIDISPAFAGGATDALTYTVMDVAAFSPTNAAGTDTVNAVEIGALTDPGATITSTALKVGAGWDNVLTVNGTVVVNSTGQVPTTQLTGTLVSTSSDSGSSTLIQGDTLAVNGGTNGVDTSLTGDTYTINLDTTEIGTTTFGSGSGITWTFDAGATDPTIAFASDLVTITAATTTLSGDLKLTGADILDTNDNEFLKFTSVASAVNELTIANAATAGVVTLAATGGDTDIALSIDAKGADALNLNNTGTGDILIGGGSGSTGCTVTNSNGNLGCTGTISGSGVAATSVPFSGITGSTNTTAAMVVGTGASLNYSDSGTINASSLIGATWAAPGTIGSGTPNTGAFTTLSASGALAANGGITFDAATDTVGAHTLSGTLDANTNIITNIGNSATDFDTGGGLTLAGNLVVQGTTGLTFNTGVGGDITFALGEKIDNDTDGTLALTAGVTSLSGDLKLTGADILDTNDNEFLRFTPVASAVNEITIANAATGNGVTLAATGGDANVALSIDAKGTGALNLNNTGTGDILIGGGSGSTGCTITNSTGAFSCSAGITATAMKWNALTDPDGALTLAHGVNATTFGWTPTGALNAFTMNVINNGGSATTQNGLTINNAVAGSFTDTTTESLILVQQLDTTLAGTTVVTDGIKIDSAAASGMTNGLTVTNSGGNITTGISISDTAGGTLATGIGFSGTFTNEISLSNGETINNVTDGTVLITSPITSLSGDLTITGNDITFGNAETISNDTDGTVLITSPVTSLSGDLTITGNDITFGNAETISNATDGTVLITSPVTSLSGDLTITGNDITFGNAETISNDTDGTVLITSPVTSLSGDLKLTGADILDTNDNEFLRFTALVNAVNELTIANAAANGIVTLETTGGDANVALSIDSKGSDALNLNGTATGDVNIAGGYGTTGCTIYNSTGNFSCNGTITGTFAGTIPWSEIDVPAGNLSLAHAGYTTAFTFDSVTAADAFALSSTSLTTGTLFDLSSTSTAGGASGVSKLLDISRSGTNANASHTAYGLYSAVTNTGTTSTNIGGYFSASGATNNYGLIVGAGNVGIGTTGPDAKLDSLATTEQLRLTYADGTVYTGFTVDSGGDLTIDAIGGDVSLASGDNLNLTASTDLIFGTTSLGEATAANDSGAYLTGVFDEFDSSNSTNVQAVLNDLDIAITSGGGSSMWSLAGGVLYPTSATNDLAVGGTTLVSPFSVDESANTVRIGEGANSSAILNMYASDADTGSITYTTSDAWAFEGGNVGIGLTNPTDGKLQVVSTSAGAETVPFVIQNSDLAPGTAVRMIMAATTAISDTNGHVDFLGTRKADGGMNLGILLSDGATGPVSKLLINGSSTNQALSTESPSMTITTGARQWATGALATQRDIAITQPTYSFVGASTLTDAATVGIAGAPVKSTNATITNTHGLLIQAGAVSTATNSYGLTVNAQTGASNNYVAALLGGNVGIGTAAPTTLLQLGTAGTTAGTLSLAGATSGLVTVDVAAEAGTWSLTLPITDGDPSNVLITDGAGNTSWTPVSALSAGDADTVDGLHAASFLRSDTSDNYTSGTITFDTGTELDMASGSTLDVNGDLTIADTSIAFDGASTAFVTTGAFTLTPGGAVLLGDGGDTMQINSSDWDISTTGDMTGIGAITADGTISFTGTTIGLGTSNSVTTFNIGTGTGGNAINIGTNNTAKDTLNIGSALDDVIINGAGTGSLINFANFDVATTGNITVQPAYGLDTNAAGALALGDANATSVSICNSAACDTILIGNNADADTITIGDSTDTTVSITDDNWSITAAGVANFVSVGATTPGTGAFTTLTSTGITTLGNNSTTVEINTSDWDIGTTGDMTGIGAVTMDGAFSQTGATTFGTGTGAISLNGDVAIAANKGLTFTSGTGTITQNYSNTTGTSTTINHTNSGSSGANVSTVLSLAITGTDNATGTNVITAIDIPNVTAHTNNSYYGIVAGTGLTDILRYNGTQIISGLGVLQSAGLSGTYSNALTLSSTSNVFTGTIGQSTPLAGAFTTLSATPASNVTALTLTGTNVTSADLAYFNSKNTSGIILDTAYGAAASLAGALTGIKLDLSTNLTATGYNVTGQSIALPAVTNTGANTYAYKGLVITGGALIQNTGAGTNTWTGLDITMPNITQTTGTVTSTGLKITGGTVTSGTSYALTTDANAGNVGIGTTGPAKLLEITGTTTPGGTLRLSSSSTNVLAGESFGELDFYSVDASTNGVGITGFIKSVAINAGVTSALTFGTRVATNATEVMRIDSTGNVGIGTTAPTTILNIDDNAATGTGLKITGGGNGGSLATFVRDVGADTTVAISGSGGDAQMYFTTTGNTFSIGTDSTSFKISDNTTLGTNDRLIIDLNGNVGIGTTGPSFKLEVAGASGVDNIKITPGTGAIGDSGYLSVNNRARFGYDGANVLISDQGTSKPIAFQSGAAGNDVMRITTTGNVGIGTTAPGSLLSVYRAPSDTVGDTVLGVGYNGSSTDVWGLRVAATTYDLNIDRYYGGWSATPIMTFDRSAGYVGIGTTAPGALLDVSANTLAAIRVSSTNASLAAGEIIGKLEFYKTDASTGGAGTPVYLQARTTDVGGSFELDFITGTITTPVTTMSLSKLGNVGIGTTAPAYKLDVDSSTTSIAGKFTTTAAAAVGAELLLYQNSTSPAVNDNVGYLIFQGNDVGGADGDYYSYILSTIVDPTDLSEDANIEFYNMLAGTANLAAYIDSAGTVYADVGTGTFSPYYSYNYIPADKNKTDFEYGDVVKLKPGTNKEIDFTNSNNDPLAYGVVHPPEGYGSIPEEFKDVVMGEDQEAANLDNYPIVPVAHLGTAITKVYLKPGEVIDTGDAITSSDISRYGQKSTKAGTIIGKSSQVFDPNSLSCTTIPKIESVVWPDDPTKTNNVKPCFTLPDGSHIGKVMIFVNVSYHDPDVYLTDSGDLNLVKSENGNYVVEKTESTFVKTTVDKVGAFASLVAANIKAGAIETQSLVTQSLEASVATIQTLSSNLLTSNLLKVKLISPIPDGTDVTIRIGNESNASNEGKLAIQNSEGNEVALIDSEGNARLQGDLSARQATFSGELYAKNIHSTNLDEIQSLLTQVTADQAILLAATSSADLSASTSAQLVQLITSDLYVTSHAAISSLLVDADLTVTKINSLSGPLQLQSLALAPIELMAGLVTIDTMGNVRITGNVAIGGDLDVAGRTTTSGLVLKDNLISNQPINQSTDSAKLLSLEDNQGQLVASVNASGSAQFGSISTPQLVIAGPDATQSGTIVDGVITTNSTIGQAVVPAGVKEITIQNPKVTDYTLVYVTPTSITNNYVLYVKSKQAGQFVIGFDQALPIDVNFNWWIVQVQN